MVKKDTNRDRRAKVAAMQAQQKAAERRRLLTVIGAIVVVIVLVAAGVTWAVMGKQREQAALVGLAGDAQSASCDPVTNDPAEPSGNHIGPGTNKPDTTKVHYSTVPPSSGPHLASPVLSDRRVYTTADAPPIEGLVHNLEHGYTILWYDRSVEKDQAAAFAALAKEINAMPESAGKFIISPWDPAYGAFPAGKKYALSHWSADVDRQSGKVSNAQGHRQLCGGLSSAVVVQFVKDHPWSSAPEPGAA